MTGNELLEGISFVDERLVMEAEETIVKKKKVKRIPWNSFAAAAAGIVVVTGAAAAWSLQSGNGIRMTGSPHGNPISLLFSSSEEKEDETNEVELYGAANASTKGLEIAEKPEATVEQETTIETGMNSAIPTKPADSEATLSGTIELAQPEISSSAAGTTAAAEVIALEMEPTKQAVLGTGDRNETVGETSPISVAAVQKTEEECIAEAENENAAETSVVATAETEVSNQVKQIASSTNELGKKLMAELIKESDGDNVLISSYSIETALSLLSHCSQEGEAIDQLRGFLGTDQMTESELLAAQAELMAILCGDMEKTEKQSPDSGENAEESANERTERACVVEIANAVYVNEDLPLVPAFEQMPKLLESYQSEIAVKDLSAVDTMNEINDWVNEKTHEMIPSVLDEPFDEMMQMVLMNTVYFYGSWLHDFRGTPVENQPFYGADRETEVPMMRQKNTFLYAETEDYQIIQLPYQADYRMDVYLPKDVELTGQWSQEGYLQQLTEEAYPFEETRVILQMPQFEMEFGVELSQVLESMGLESVFEPQIYDRISETELGVGQILHKTALRNDVEGTEAAALTMVTMYGAAMETVIPVEMTIDRPFYFTITHEETGLDLFEGCILNLEE